jgi:PKD repeat protein
MKLWSTILALCLLALLVPGVFAVQNSGTAPDAELLTEAPLSQDYIEHKNTFQPIEWVKQIIFNDQNGYIPAPADSSHLKGKKVSKKALEAEVLGISDVPADDAGGIVSAPATYDLRTIGQVSPVKNQGACGSCWAFATYGSMESEALPDQLYDFSENNLKNTHGFDYAPCSGGNAEMATAYLTRWSGAVAEADDPYVASNPTSPSGLPVQEHAQEILIIPGRSGSLDNDNIKAALQTTGALYTTMYYGSTSYNSASKAYYYSGTSGANHAVTIVGWDDAYSRSNFLTSPPGDGAFIVKNSYGASWGDNGYFYVSYYDVKIGYRLTAFTGESATNYYQIYQYDPLGWIQSIGYRTDTAWAANVFTATKTESIAAVGLVTNQVNTAYQISIYKNPDQGPVSTAGAVSTTQGTIGIPGYHTVSLPTLTNVQPGDKFSVVVRYQTPNYYYPIPVEKPFSGYSSKATASAGQSYTSSTGTAWTDLTASSPNTNVCLKVYTVTSATTVKTPVASFSGTPTSGVAPLAVTFTDASTNSPTSWVWTFGDGATSTLRNPSHTYTKAGTYTVSLKATNAGGSNTLTKAGYITVTAAPVAPAASFTGTPTSGVAPLTVTFADSSTNSPTSWVWTFGDGTTSTLRNPSHIYSSAGTYTVSLKATNAGGSNTLTKAGYITVTAAPAIPVADFSGTPTSGMALLAVTFTDRSSNNPTMWAWSFGDGATSSAKNPSHTCTKAGTYTVSLRATNGAGGTTEIKTGYIAVGAPTPTPTPTPASVLPDASFTATPVSGQPPLAVQFTDTSSGNPTQWSWNFGDRSTSTIRDPSHIYTKAGFYTVTLTVRNANGSDKVTVKKYITVTPVTGKEKTYISLS